MSALAHVCSWDTCDPNLPVAGVFAWPCGSDGDERFPYVERCDPCDIFANDEEAAEAIATAVDGIVVLVGVHRNGRRRWQPAVYPWPKDLSRTLRAFAESDPRLAIWANYPNVTKEEDAATDQWACGSVSRQLAAFLLDAGFDAELVHAEDAEHPWADDHWWVRVGDTDIDFTARQFHNLEHPPAAEHQDLPCPLIWRANGRHPVVGGYARVTTTDPRKDS